MISRVLRHEDFSYCFLFMIAIMLEFKVYRFTAFYMDKYIIPF